MDGPYEQAEDDWLRHCERHRAEAFSRDAPRLDLIHGPLAVNPPKPKPLIMEPRQFAALLGRCAEGTE